MSYGLHQRCRIIHGWSQTFACTFLSEMKPIRRGRCSCKGLATWLLPYGAILITCCMASNVIQSSDAGLVLLVIACLVQSFIACSRFSTSSDEIHPSEPAESHTGDPGASLRRFCKRPGDTTTSRGHQFCRPASHQKTRFLLMPVPIPHAGGVKPTRMLYRKAVRVRRSQAPGNEEKGLVGFVPAKRLPSPFEVRR